MNLDVRPTEIWETRVSEREPWRRVRVLDVISDVVELQYLDMPEVNVARTFKTTLALMSKEAVFRFVAKAPPT